MALEDLLKNLHEREVLQWQGKIDQIKTNYLVSYPRVLKSTSELTGIPQERLAEICAEVAWYDGSSWTYIMQIIYSFYAVQRRKEAEDQGKDRHDSKIQKGE